MREESQLYEIEIPGLAVNDFFVVPLTQQPYSKYKPFNFVMITNNSSQKLRLVVNDSVRKLVMPGTILTFDASTIPAVWDMKIYNKGVAATNEGEVTISFQKVKGIVPRFFRDLTGGLRI